MAKVNRAMKVKTRHVVLVRKRGVWMNKRCDHSAAQAKWCPYCDVCRHGVTRYGHCAKCNTDESWRDAPITDAELDELLDYFASLPPYAFGRRPPERYYHLEPSLLPLAVKKLRALVRADRAKAKKKKAAK